ncbi:MAG: hypothetical protein LIP28_10820 [Deltaproteobacteria bacterium]|nr:hypothetical protein [Deltaproteobacteria bacterium]
MKKPEREKRTDHTTGASRALQRDTFEVCHSQGPRRPSPSANFQILAAKLADVCRSLPLLLPMIADNFKFPASSSIIEKIGNYSQRQDIGSSTTSCLPCGAAYSHPRMLNAKTTHKNFNKLGILYKCSQKKCRIQKYSWNSLDFFWERRYFLVRQ